MAQITSDLLNTLPFAIGIIDQSEREGQQIAASALAMHTPGRTNWVVWASMYSGGMTR